MEVIVLLVFVSLMLVACAIGFFAWNVKEGTHEHTERLALLPLRDDASPKHEKIKKEPSLGNRTHLLQ